MSADILTPEEALQRSGNFVCLELEKDMIDGLFKLQEKLGFPFGTLISEALRPFVDAFLPFVDLGDLYEKGELTAESLMPVAFNIKKLLLKSDIAEARIVKDLKKIAKKKKLKLRFAK